jgi:hypothetical protein
VQSSADVGRAQDDNVLGNDNIVDLKAVGLSLLSLATCAGALHFGQDGSVDLLLKIRRHGTQ